MILHMILLKPTGSNVLLILKKLPLNKIQVVKCVYLYTGLYTLWVLLVDAENAKYFLYVLPVARYSYYPKSETSSVTRVTRKLTLPETNIAPENGWLLGGEISYWEGLFSGDMRVSGRVYK